MDETDDNQPVVAATVIQAGVAGFFENAGIPYSFSNFSREHLSYMRDWDLNWENVFSANRTYNKDKAAFVVHEHNNTTPLFAFSFQLSIKDRYCAITHVERGPKIDAKLFDTALAIDCASFVADVATQQYPAQCPFKVAIKNPLDYMLPHYKKIIIENYQATPDWNPTNRLLTIA